MRVYSCGSDFPDIRIVTFQGTQNRPTGPLPSAPASVSRQLEPAIWGRERDRANCDLDLSEVFSSVYFHRPDMMPIF